MQFLVDSGVDVLVTLNAERKPPVDEFRRNAAAAALKEDADASTISRASKAAALEWVKVEIVDFASPTKEQIDEGDILVQTVLT